jgi:transcriptional regulator with XRE-family HTH domain
MNDTSLIGDTISDLRKRAGMSQTTLAEITGISQSALSDIEQGRRSPRYDTLGKISSALALSLEELIHVDLEQFIDFEHGIRARFCTMHKSSLNAFNSKQLNYEAQEFINCLNTIIGLSSSLKNGSDSFSLFGVKARLDALQDAAVAAPKFLNAFINQLEKELFDEKQEEPSDA